MTVDLIAPEAQTGGHAPTSIVLSERQRQVLELMAGGRTNAAIGAKLYLAEDTVKTVARQAFRKLQRHDRTGAVVRALQLGLVTVPGVGPRTDAPDDRPGGRWVWRRDDEPATEPTITLSATPGDAELLLNAWSKGRPPLDRSVARRHALDVLARLCGTEAAR